MPPGTTVPDHNNGHEGNSPLSDENVAILYQIIQTAEQYPEVETHPFRAIFSAYDTVLPANGLDSDHDQVYLRFLFRLGDRREEGEPLFETFEKLLDEIGIQIEFNTEEDGIQEVTRNPADIEQHDEQAHDAAGGLRQTRRAPWQQTYDAEDESIGFARARADSRASTSRLEVSKKASPEERPASRATTRPTERTSNPATPRKASFPVARDHLMAGEWIHGIQQQFNFREPIATTDQVKSRVSSLNVPKKAPYDDADFQTDEVSSSVSGSVVEAARRHGQGNVEEYNFILGNNGKLHTTSRTQLLRDADAFQSYRIRSVARDIIERWCYAAFEARDHHEHRYRVASAHDKEILLRQAFEHWRFRLHGKKQADETKRYFDRLEKRAAKARDLYLLTKAFTHWLQCAQDEVQQALLARQHILSIKYFHAWKDLTIANQKEAHLQALQKNFEIWRRRHFQATTNDIKADLSDQRRLIRSAYWHWFWSFCEARAPEWQARRLKQRHLLKWMGAFQMNRQRNLQVTLHNQIAAKRFFVSTWLDKTRKTLHNQDVATAYSRQTLTSRALENWVRTRKYGPLIQQISNMADWRVARATFALFVDRFRLEEQAKRLDRLRVMRNAWTQWNDKLRWQTLARRIDDRYQLEALYKWTIAERCNLLKRLSRQRVKEQYLLKFRDQWSLRESRRNDALRLIETQFTRRSLHLILLQWHLSSNTLREHKLIAEEFYVPKVTHDALQSMRQHLKQVKTLNRMANDAVFFFDAKRAVKRWHAAAIESKRQKRRNAYIQIRRITKMNIASKMLQRWRSATAVAQDMEDEAAVFRQNCLLRLAATFFGQWKHAYDFATDLQFQAADHYEERLFLRHIHVWSKRTSHLTELDTSALISADLQRQKLALTCFNKLRLRLIEIKGPQATAENLKIRYQKRQFYNMLRHWQDKTAARLDRPIRNRAILTNRAKKTKVLPEGDDRLGATARAEDWTELDHGDWIPQLEAQSSTTPLPSYLNTPSNRAARARALIPESSTTPKGTPFQTRLRAQLNATPQQGNKKGLFDRSTARRPRGYSFGASASALLPVEGSGSTTVVDREE